MEYMTQWVELFFGSLQSFGEEFMGAIPNVLGAIFILFFGWLLAKLLSKAVNKLLITLKFNNLASKIKATEMLKKANISLKPSELISRFIYWIILLVVWTTAAETLGWTAVSEEISKLISYLPTLFSAVLFFIIGIFVVTFVRDFIHGATSSLGISSGKIIGTVVFYLLFIIVTLTALNQAGMDTSIITSNMMIIIGSVMFAGAISYGFASRTALTNILASFFMRKNFEIGQHIVIDELEGKIVKITNVSVIIEGKNGEKIVFPSNDLMTKVVRVK